MTPETKAADNSINAYARTFVLKLARSLVLPVMLLAGVMTQTAMSQNVVVTANDSPITNYDIAQRIKLLSVLRKSANAQAATDSLIEDRLKLIETRKYGINPSEQEIANEASRDATERKIPPQQLAAGLQRGGIDKSHWQEHWRAGLSWRILVAALNKSVNVSEEEVKAEAAKKGGAVAAQEYRIQQIIFVVPTNATAGAYSARMAEATNLRSRFKDCTSGVQLARALRDVAVQPQISRRANALSTEIVALLDRTPVGQLTPPSRGATGVETIAVCGKSDSGANSAASDTIRETLLIRKLQADSDRRYAEIRKRAVIVRR